MSICIFPVAPGHALHPLSDPPLSLCVLFQLITLLYVFCRSSLSLKLYYLFISLSVCDLSLLLKGEPMRASPVSLVPMLSPGQVERRQKQFCCSKCSWQMQWCIVQSQNFPLGLPGILPLLDRRLRILVGQGLWLDPPQGWIPHPTCCEGLHSHLGWIMCEHSRLSSTPFSLHISDLSLLVEISNFLGLCAMLCNPMANCC